MGDADAIHTFVSFAVSFARASDLRCSGERLKGIQPSSRGPAMLALVQAYQLPRSRREPLGLRTGSPRGVQFRKSNVRQRTSERDVRQDPISDRSLLAKLHWVSRST